MKTKISTVVAVLVVFCVSDASAWYMNKDVTNLGPDAEDLAVLISGNHNVTWNYKGYSSGPKRGRFDSFADGPDGPNTLLRWRNFDDGSDTTINTNQTIHIGWAINGNSQIVDMYWTDASGNRIPGSVVYNIDTEWTYETAEDIAQATWQNAFDPSEGGRQSITISNIQYTLLDSEIDPNQLNAENPDLVGLFQPLEGGDSFSLDFGQSQTLLIPGNVPEESAVVLRYEISAVGSAAQTIDFVQFVAPPDIPTVSQWGLIVMAALLVLAGTIVIVRRRRVAA